MQSPAILVLTLGLLTLLLYLGTLSFQFVWDDIPLIVHNSVIRSWNLPAAFANDLWHNMANAPRYYRPVLVVWFMLNYSISNLHSWGWHLALILVHIAAVLGVFALARKLGLEYWTAALAALIFAFHPVHVECVAWVCSSDTLASVFFILSLVAFLRSREHQEPRWLIWRAASLLLLGGALLTKEVAATFTPVIALCVLLRVPRESSLKAGVRQSLIVALPYALLTAGYLLVRGIVLRHLSAPSVSRTLLIHMAETWPAMLCGYLRLLLYPVRLSGIYNLPYVHVLGVKNFVLPLLIVCGAAWGIWYWSRRTADPVVSFAGLWILITLAPVLYTINFRPSDFIHDRYLYLPSVGFAILVAKAIRLLPRFRRMRMYTLQATVATVLALAYGGATYAYEVYWSSDLLLFYRAHTISPQSDFAAVELARELARLGRYQRAIDVLTELVQHPSNAASGYPPYYLDYLLGDAYLRMGDKAKARELLEESDALSPRTPDAQYTRTSVATVLADLSEYEKALAICSDVLKSESLLTTTLLDCGNVYVAARQYPEAEKLLSTASARIPDQAAPKYFLGRLYVATGRIAEAEASFAKAVALDPTVYDYFCWYARTLALRGDIAGARGEFLAALALNGDGAEAKAGLAALPTAP